MQKTVPRLYEQFIPTSYNISWHLDSVEEDGLVYGNVTIHGEQVDPGTIRLHAKDLDIDQVMVNKELITGFTTSENDELVIPHDTPGSVEIVITYSLKISDSMHGIYPCYFEDNGVKKKLYATQFQSHHAREAFPCVDEPEAKAIFSVTLYTKPDVTALSNMPAKYTTDEATPGIRYTSYEPTPRMSTYLLAFVVGDLHKKTASSARGVEVNVWATHAQPADSLDWGLTIATEVIDFFEDFYGVPYPLPKCDHVAVPDFSAGAMENWGLITYREACLLASENDPTTLKHYIATVIAHELAHQWFGNLVTMRWWDDLWLNESFANVMQYIALDHLHPDWHIWEAFATDETPLALSRDSFRDVQAVSYPINSPSEINAAFDKAILYAKGSRLIRMAIAYAGEEQFRAGLEQYFKTYQYNNAAARELWQCIGEAAEKDIAAFMDTWIRQPGYPRVTLRREDSRYHVEQHRFAIDGHVSPELWPIPLSSNDASTRMIFDTRSQTAEDTPLVLNQDGVGHFITLHDDEMFDQLCQQIANETITVPEALDLSYSTTLLAESGSVPSSRLVRLLSVMARSENDAIWVGVMSIVSQLSRFYEQNASEQRAFNAYLIELVSPMYALLGSLPRDTDTLIQAKTRTYVMDLLAVAKDTRVLKHASDQIEQDTSMQVLQGNSRLAIMKAAVLDNRPGVIETLYTLCRATSDAALRDDLAKALSTTEDTGLIEKLIRDLSTPGLIKPQDLPRWFGYLMKNPLTREQTWEWMCNNWSDITKTFSDDMSFDKFPKYASQMIYGEHWLSRYQTFFGEMNVPALDRSVRIGIQAILARTTWIERDRELLTSAITTARGTIK